MRGAQGRETDAKARGENRGQPRRRGQSRRTETKRVRESCAAGMAPRTLWVGQATGTRGGWGVICLVASLLLQHQGVHSKCYFQAQGKAGRGVGKDARRGRGRKGSEMVRWQHTQTPWRWEAGEATRGGSVPLPLGPGSDIPRSPPAPCHHEGKYFSLGESWLRKDCFHCTCLHPVGVGCCDT